jgi:2'-5' RNA ligase
MPFKWPEKKMQYLTATLYRFFKSKSPFTINLQDFGAFEPRVIFVKVNSDPQLSALQTELGRVMAETLSIHNANYSNRAFQPHITIAFRDLKRSHFYQAWEYYKGQSYRADFQATNITLLKHNGKIWEQETVFALQNR